MADSVQQQLLAPDDLAVLEAKQYSFELAQVGALVHLLIHNFALPEVYTSGTVDLLLRLPLSFPLAAPDMFWTFPEVRLKSTNAYPAASAHFEAFGTDRRWQRWSRHFTQAWRPGADNLQTFLASIRHELKKGI